MLSGPEVPEVGLDDERNVKAPVNPVMCSRRKNAESLCRVDSLLAGSGGVG